MLDQVLAWAAVNSGSRNLAGLATWRACSPTLSRRCRASCGLEARRRSKLSTARGARSHIEHGRHLHLKVRPDAPVQLLFTGHMDTVFGADHAFQETRWLEDGVLNGPGVADMKGGIAVMLAALKAVEASPRRRRFGYEVVINSDEEVGSLASAALLARAAARASAPR